MLEKRVIADPGRSDNMVRCRYDFGPQKLTLLSAPCADSWPEAELRSRPSDCLDNAQHDANEQHDREQNEDLGQSLARTLLPINEQH